MCDLTQSIDIIDRLLSVLGDRKNFQKIYSEALGGSVSGDISMIRSDLFNKPNYLGALLFEDTASVLLLLQQTGLVHYENLTGTLSEREQLQETELWSPGYNDKGLHHKVSRLYKQPPCRLHEDTVSHMPQRGCRCRLGRRMPHRKICVRLEQPVAYSKGTTAVIHSTHVSDSGFSLNIFCTCLDIRERSCNFT